jgi:DNA-binding response OmpR family regulator
MDARRRILVVEDEEDLAASLKYSIEKEGGYVVDVAGDGETALREFARHHYDLAILDISLPGIDGLTVCREMRRRPEAGDLRILILTARVEEMDKVVGLEVGADDYVTKPFSLKELLARVRALLRRTERSAEAQKAYSDGVMFLDAESRVLRVGGKDLALTRKEFDLISALVKNRGRVMTREQILQQVWGYQYFGETRTVDVHVRRLRSKLGQAARGRIETIIGVGYRFRAPEDQQEETR